MLIKLPITQLLQGLVELVYPRVCLLCSATCNTTCFCDRCDKQMQPVGFPCPRCAMWLPAMPSNAVNCPHCQNEEFTFSSTYSLGPYERALRTAVLLMKDQRNEALAHHMGKRLAVLFPSTSDVAAVVPVPLHWTRRLWRGYNQSATLAYALANTCKLPISFHWLWRRLQTPMQVSVTPIQRRKNLLSAMKAKLPGSLKGKTILLVDDVMTTGATAEACTRALLDAGAGNVIVVVVARAVGH